MSNSELCQSKEEIEAAEAVREAAEAEQYAKGVPKINLFNFVSLVLVKPAGGRTGLHVFYNLVEQHGLTVFDDGQEVSSSELLNTLRERERERERERDIAKANGDYRSRLHDSFWEPLNKESLYSVFPDDVKNAFNHAGKNQYPWLNWDIKLTWLDIKEPCEAVRDDGSDSHAITEPASTEAIQVNSNNTDFSQLLNIPQKIDDWFPAIDDMTKGFYEQYGKIPNKTEAWQRLNNQPPDRYGITPGTDRGDKCLKMGECNPLSKSAFYKRWGNYTANKTQ